MSTWFSDDANPQLLIEAKQIAWEFLDRSGEIDDAGEVNQFLTGKIEQMIGQGQAKQAGAFEPCNSRLQGISTGANH